MKRFDDVYNNWLLNEQDGEDDGKSTPVVDTLSPEGEVMLVRLINSAISITASPDDISKLESFGDINSKNAKEALTMMRHIISKYNSTYDF